MKNISWEMEQVFHFPQVVGAVTDVQTVKIAPQWMHKQNEDSVQLDGVYHFAVNLAFEPTSEATLLEGIYIDELDFANNKGYFEYALPLAVDLPQVVQQPDRLRLSVADEKWTLVDGGGCKMNWTVSCKYEAEELVQEIVESPPVVAEVIEEQVVIHEDVEVPIIVQKEPLQYVEVDDFYEQLSDAYNVHRVSVSKN